MEAFSSFNCLAKDTYQPKKYLTDAKLFYLTSTNLCEESRKFIGSVSSNSDPLSFLSCGKWRSHDWTWKQSCTMNSTLPNHTRVFQYKGAFMCKLWSEEHAQVIHYKHKVLNMNSSKHELKGPSEIPNTKFWIVLVWLLPSWVKYYPKKRGKW